ncbi:MAG: hypothetical protein J5793_02595 [Clostridia bacterium]|nr:hypothetical protein [Clostridia bacterium]
MRKAFDTVKFRKTLALITACLLLSVCFAACGNDKVPGESSVPAVSDGISAEESSSPAGPSGTESDPDPGPELSVPEPSGGPSGVSSEDESVPDDDSEEPQITVDGRKYTFFGVSFELPECFEAVDDGSGDMSLLFIANGTADSVNVYFAVGSKLSDFNGDQLMSTYQVMLGDIEDFVFETYKISGRDALKVAYSASNSALGYDMRQTYVYVFDSLGCVTVTCSSMTGLHDADIDALVSSIKA